MDCILDSNLIVGKDTLVEYVKMSGFATIEEIEDFLGVDRKWILKHTSQLKKYVRCPLEPIYCEGGNYSMFGGIKKIKGFRYIDR